MASPPHSTANDSFALLIKVIMKCTGKLQYSDEPLVLTQIKQVSAKTHTQNYRERDWLSGKTCGATHLGRRD